MPGWLIHMDAARRAIDQLATNANATPIFGNAGPTAAELQAIGHNHPAYVALGAIGPDIFFLLPDFQPPIGSALFGAAATIKDLYTWWDDNFLGPWQDMMGPIEDNRADELGALTGGLSTQINAITSRAFSFLIDAVKTMVVRNFDVFSLLGSGVISAVDEQTFFWSDMLHYRKTYEFTHALWKKAVDEGNEPAQAFALGWMAHLAGDVTGHCFVNQKGGGPYRTHWQRHHLTENHMDAKVYDSRFGTQPIYSMLNNAALHLWIAFNPDGTSHNDFFAPQPGPSYSTGDKTPDLLDRHSKWDVDSDLPDDLADFLAEALKEFYNDTTVDLGPKGQWASHPTIIEEIHPGSQGYPDADSIITTYWWLFKYVKFTTTDYYKVRRPDPPEVYNPPVFPSPPGTGAADDGPGATSDFWQDFLSILLAILAWIIYIAQVAIFPIVAIVGIINGAATYPVRKLFYENFELPLYNAWEALHWYLAMTGFIYPTQDEMNPSLHTLGVGIEGVWQAVLDALADPAGGLHPPHTNTEPSGINSNEVYPHDLVSDPQTFILGQIPTSPLPDCKTDMPSEFMRPWRWPDRDNQGDPVPLETGRTRPDFHVGGDDPTVLLGGHPGDNATRTALENCQNAGQTDTQGNDALNAGKHLGDAVDYSAYVMALLTRDNPGTIANFNLDGDRGYGYLCWDWLRLEKVLAGPPKFKGHADEHIYHAPTHPGAGWCQQDITVPGPPNPVMHQNGSAANPPVDVRYIDRENKNV
jgi:hypothetical protein